jgi:methyltransferase
VVGPYLALLAALAGERLYELRRSRRSATAAFARGAVEYGQRHFVWMRLLHGAFLVSCALEVTLGHRPFHPAAGTAFFVAALLAQGLRYWAIVSLGERWNVRVIVEPGVPAEVCGPYRWVRHPNYLAVAIEGVAVPMIHGAWMTAVAFTILNAALLVVRIRCEERALRTHCGYAARLGDRPRLFPRPALGRLP